jgi:hypothetical protein
VGSWESVRVTEGVAEDPRGLDRKAPSVHIDHIPINQLPIRELMIPNVIDPNKIKMTSAGMVEGVQITV